MTSSPCTYCICQFSKITIIHKRFSQDTLGGVRISGTYALYSTLCSSRKYPYPTPPTPFTKGNGNSEGRGRGQKGGIFPWGRGLLTGGLSKIVELVINNSFSVEQAISYFTVTGVSKPILLFALTIFSLQSAKCFFSRLM